MEPTTCVEAEPFALRVTDDSMEPEFEKGCIIIVDPTGVLEDGAFVIAEHEDGYIFRQLKNEKDHYYLRPLNDNYMTVALGSRLDTVRGVIVQRAGRRRRYHKRY